MPRCGGGGGVVLACVVLVVGWWCGCVVSSHRLPSPPQSAAADYLDDNFLYEMRNVIYDTDGWTQGGGGGIHPWSVDGWAPRGVQLGQVSGVSVDPKGRPVVFHRGPRVWDHRTFNSTHHYQGEEGVIAEDLVLVLDPESGSVVHSWGSSLFLLPHGITVDHEGNTWLTDLALHQVFKFQAGSEKAAVLSLGEAGVPGSDNKHFCKPTSVAVAASTGDVFVADGYCNGRVMRFDPDGTLKQTFGHLGRDGSSVEGLYVPHGLALDESVDTLCVADRENRRVVCVKAGLTLEHTFGRHLHTLHDPYHGRVFDVAAYKGVVMGVGGGGGDTAATGFTATLSDGQVRDAWRPSHGDFHNPHSVALSGDGTALYVAEIGPNRVWKFAMEKKKKQRNKTPLYYYYYH